MDTELIYCDAVEVVRHIERVMKQTEPYRASLSDKRIGVVRPTGPARNLWEVYLFRDADTYKEEWRVLVFRATGREVENGDFALHGVQLFRPGNWLHYLPTFVEENIKGFQERRQERIRKQEEVERERWAPIDDTEQFSDLYGSEVIVATPYKRTE